MKAKPTYQDLVKEVKKLREEIKLKESENKFKNYFESNKAIMLQLDTETKQIICANKAAIDFYGYSKKELFKKSINDLNTLSIEEINSLMKKAMKNKSNYFEFKHRLANGKIRDVAIYASPTMIGKEMQMFVTVYDVTEQKKAEFEILKKNNELAASDEEIRAANEELIATTDALKEINNELIISKGKAEANEEKYKQLSNLTFEGIVIHEKGIVLDLNLSLAKMVGYNREEIIGKNIIKLLVHEKYHKTIIKNINENNVLPYEILGIKKDGTEFPVEIEARYIHNKNDNKKIRVAAIRDISLRKRVETQLKKLSTAVEQSANTIVITDIEGNIEYTNPKFTEITGYTAKEALGQNPRILNAGIQPKEYYVGMWKTISSGQTWKGEFHNKKKNGDFYWENVTITPIKNEAGEIVNYLAIKEDVTNVKEYQKKLIVAKEKAEESDQLKTEFLHNMSHEIRTPLNGILGFSNLLDKSGFLPEKQQQHIQFIQKSGEQLLHIIDDILEISRLVTRQVIVKNKNTNLNDLLSELYADFEMKAKEKQLAIFLKKELSDENSIIITDKLILNKILYNLLENAIKFTEKGFIEIGYILVETRHRVRPSADALSLQDKTIQLYVKDTGVGIRPEKQKLIFERFSQEEKDISQKTGGLGLGLSIALESTKLLNGAITIKSEKGKGATFFVTIPYSPVSSEI